MQKMEKQGFEHEPSAPVRIYECKNCEFRTEDTEEAARHNLIPHNHSEYGRSVMPKSPDDASKLLVALHHLRQDGHEIDLFGSVLSSTTRKILSLMHSPPDAINEERLRLLFHYFRVKSPIFKEAVHKLLYNPLDEIPPLNNLQVDALKADNNPSPVGDPLSVDDECKVDKSL